MRKFSVVLWPILLLSAAAAADKFPAYPVQPASQYPSCQTQKGISVAIEPVSNKDAQKKHFGINFSSQGFLPVLVVLENGTEGGSLLLQRESVECRVKDDRADSSSGGTVSGMSKTSKALSIALTGGIISQKLIAGASEVKQNILVRELRSQTIAPGKAGSGFLYLPVGKPDSAKLQATLNIPLSLGDQQELLAFTFNLEVPSEGKTK